MTKSLENIRVLDLSRILAGPFCTQILGDLGADVIKVERPGAGDDTRMWGPPFMKDTQGNDTTESAYYLSANRNKKSVAIDIQTKEGQKLIHELLKTSDILIQNFKVGGLEKYGLGYEQIKEKHPHIIYCAISGFGQNGPRASEPGYDFLAQAMAGLMSATGNANEEPMKVGVALSDIITGLNAAIGILAALHNREKTGKGQMVDVALTDCTLASLSNLAQYYLTSGRTAPRFGNAHSTIVPYQSFKTSDDHIIIAVGNDNQFARLSAALGKEEWASDQRFAKNAMRVQNREILIPMIKDIIAQKTTDEWLKIFHEVNIPAGPVNTMDKVFEMEQMQSRDMQIEMEHTLSGKTLSLVGSPIKLSDTPVSYDNPPPYLGQHTEETLEKLLGMSEEEISHLKDQRIIEAK